MKVLVFGDIHLSDRPPSSCTDSYNEDMLDLLRQTVTVAESYQVSAVVWAGDVFHSKAPSRNSHRLVQQVISIGHAYPCPWYIVPGNHDITHDRLDSILETQPLGVLFRAGARMLSGKCLEFPQLYGVPWQQEWTDDSVLRALHGYRNQVYEAGTGSHHPLVIAHAPLYPPGTELSYENFPAPKWADAMGGNGSCYYGHVHEYHGVWECGGARFANMGALSRGSLHEHNLTRQVKVAVWDSADGQFSEVVLNAKPADQVFRLREKQEITDSSGKLDEFLQSIGSTEFEVLSVEAVMRYVSELPGVDKAVKDEVAELLEWAVHQR